MSYVTDASHILLSTGNLMTASADVHRKAAFSPSSTEILTSLRSQLHSSSSLSSVSSSSSSSVSSSTAVPDTFYLPYAPQTFATSLTEPRCSYDITVKLFLPSMDPAHVSPAINHVLSMLHINTIDLLILSLPGITLDADDLVPSPTANSAPPSWLPIYRELECLHDSGTLKALGISEFNTHRLSQLFSYVNIKPTVNQINVRNCCIVPRTLIVYAKETGIELLTHNDDSDILPAQALRSVLVDEFAVFEKEDVQEVRPEWVVKYTAVVRSRGVVENKGYLAMTEIRG